MRMKTTKPRGRALQKRCQGTSWGLRRQPLADGPQPQWSGHDQVANADTGQRGESVSEPGRTSGGCSPSASDRMVNASMLGLPLVGLVEKSVPRLVLRCSGTTDVHGGEDREDVSLQERDENLERGEEH